MNPFSAIGLAGNMVQFVDFGCKLFSQTREIYSSATSASAQIGDEDAITRVLYDLSMRLGPNGLDRYDPANLCIRLVHGRTSLARSRLSRDGAEANESGQGETPVAAARFEVK